MTTKFANTSKNPLVTIITPSYNHSKYIMNAVESVLNQTYTNIEYIIIDDGSTDDSHKVLKKINEKYPFIKIILHKENKGHIRLNEGIDLAKGEYISFLSSDDWYLPDKIELQIEKFKTLDKTYGVVYSAGLRYYEDSNKLIDVHTNKLMKRGNILKQLLTNDFFIYPISPLIRKTCFEEFKFLSNFKAEGEGIYFRIAIKYNFDFVEKPLVVMRDHSYNTGKNIYLMLDDNLRYKNYLFNLEIFPKELMYLKKTIISHLLFFSGWVMIRKYNDFKEGELNIYKAIKLNPLYIFNFRFYLYIFLKIKNYVYKKNI